MTITQTPITCSYTFVLLPRRAVPVVVCLFCYLEAQLLQLYDGCVTQTSCAFPYMSVLSVIQRPSYCSSMTVLLSRSPVPVVICVFRYPEVQLLQLCTLSLSSPISTVATTPLIPHNLFPTHTHLTPFTTSISQLYLHFYKDLSIDQALEIAFFLYSCADGCKRKTLL